MLGVSPMDESSLRHLHFSIYHLGSQASARDS